VKEPLSTSANQTSQTPSAKQTPSRRRRGSVKQPNRAQIQAMQARSLVEPAANVETIDVEPAFVREPQRRPRSAGRSRSVPSSRTRVPAKPKPIALTREQEYRFIRSDLNRLLITAGVLLVAMIVLLVVIEG